MHPKQRLAVLGVTPKKGRGQNFLLDQCIATQIVDASRVGANDVVIEVGPGLGVLTAILLRRVGKLGVIEIQREFCQYLREGS